ncbi:MAG: hypothetical protein QNJ29_08415 [Rhizobiaceae bacterium]|nr:hypothetical protein [Rhizobiaceae bacterium]
MHRSGTSCLSGCLEEAGVQLGDVANASPSNIKGNKESKELRILNEDVLNNSGGSWDNPPVVLDWTDEHRARRDIIIEKMSGYDVFGFKDPRTLITLPFWHEARPEFKLVGTFRNPYSVEKSLMVRTALLPVTEPIALWFDYNKRLLDLCRTHDVSLVSFDQSLEAYNRSVSVLVRRLGLTPPAGDVFSFPEDKLRSNSPVRQSSVAFDPAHKKESDLYNALLEKSI